MKKIFSSVLVATALLLSMQAQAVNVSTEAMLRSAIVDAAVGATVDITLSNDIQLSAPLQIYAKKAETGKTINLNLNGKTLSNSGAFVMIELYKGTLNISNGTISSNATKKDAIQVFGVYEDDSEVYKTWSVLNVGRDARVISTSQSAITVMEFWGTQRYYYADRAFQGKLCDGQGSNAAPLDAAVPAYKYNSNNDSLKAGVAQRELTITQPIALAQGSTPAIDYTSSYPYYGGAVTKGTKGKNENTYAKMYYVSNPSAWSKANGVIINIDGYVYGVKYGIKVNGTLRHESNYKPIININPTAEVATTATPTLADEHQCIAVYCSGVADYNISGYIHGSTGVVVKSGDVTINNATIVSDDDKFTEIKDLSGSGVDGGRGNAIVVYSDGGNAETNKGYAGSQNVTIMGDTKVSSDAGFAVVEFTNPSQNTQVTSIDIEGGTFEAGDQGVMAFTQQAVETEKVKVVGGNVGEGAIYKGATQINLVDIVDKTEQHYITEIDVDGEKTFVVNSGTQPAAKDFKDIPAGGSAVVNAGTASLTASKKFGDLQFTNATTLTISNNAVMEVNKVVMGQDAQIIITPGAKLVVTGNAGIYAPVDENIVVKADENGMGYFLFDPTVASNRTPHATVEVYATEACSRIVGQLYNFEIIVCPFSAVSEITYELNAEDVNPGESGPGTSIQIWKNNNWVSVTREQAAEQLQAFQPMALCSTAKKGKVCKFIFKGELQGNVSGIIPVGKNYNYMGNAYLAPMSSTEFIKQLKEDANLENYMWFWKEQGFVPVTADEVATAGNIKPLGMFILKSKGSVNFDMDYESLIWNLNKPVQQ